MNVTQQGIITLLKSAITGVRYELPKAFVLDADETIKIMNRHHLISLIYVGAVNCGISMELPIMKRLLSCYYKQAIRSEHQMAEVHRICQTFNQYGIDHIPTKGCNMKALYPKPEMRAMGDADIFIRETQHADIEKAMTELGYVKSVESPNADVWDNDHLHVELHKHMCSFYNKKYYDDVWNKVRLIEGNRYAFTTEDAFIHIFNHFSRHYRGGGIGCRHVVDIYVYRRTFPEMDEHYIYQELHKLHLQNFYKNVCLLLDVWFADGVSNEAVEAISQYIFSSGSWGTLGTYAVANQVSRANKKGTVSNSRLHAILTALFPPKEHMIKRYHILEKSPYLLPVTWIHRGMRAILFRKKSIDRQMKQWRAIEDERVSNYQKHFKLVGLDIETK